MAPFLEAYDLASLLETVRPPFEKKISVDWHPRCLLQVFSEETPDIENMEQKYFHMCHAHRHEIKLLVRVPTNIYVVRIHRYDEYTYLR